MDVNEAKELKRLRDENDKLKRPVADKELENLALKEIAKGIGKPDMPPARCAHASRTFGHERARGVSGHGPSPQHPTTNTKS